MFEIPILLILIVVLALVFDFTNGAHDSGNAIATVVSTRALSPKNAVLMAGAFNFIGAFLGTHVAETIGKGIINTDMIMGCQSLLFAALVGAIGWNVFTWYIGIPSSSSHALIGGLMGAAIAFNGWNTLNYSNIISKVLLPIVISPLSGFIIGYLVMIALAWITKNVKPKKANKVFQFLQIISSGFMALSHGTNDAQKTMGIIALALFVFHITPEIHVPFWVKLACATAMLFGTMNGGWKIIKTMGSKIFKIEPVHGFASQTSTAVVIFTASFLGAPISTTQVISSSILGVGSSKRFSAVKWGVAGNMITAWIFTIPCAALVGWVIMMLFKIVGIA
jgi:PiT family inorganic phosphate transporter